MKTLYDANNYSKHETVEDYFKRCDKRDEALEESLGLNAYFERRARIEQSRAKKTKQS